MHPPGPHGGAARVAELLGQGRHPRALRLAESLLTAQGETAELLAVHSRALAVLGRLVDALDTADLAVDRWPGSAAAHAARGQALYLLERTAEAAIEADQALALDPSDALALQVRVGVLLQLGQTTYAVETARRLLSLAPGHVDSEMTMVLALAARDPQEAVAYADEVVLRRSDATGLVIRAVLLNLLDVDDYAAADAYAAFALDPESTSACLWAAVADTRGERWDEAIARSNAEPLRGHISAAQVRADAYLETGRPAESAAAARVVLDQQPRNVPVLETLNAAQVSLGAWADLVSTCNAILAMKPDDTDAVIIRARARCELGRPATAIDDLNRLLERQPGHRAALAVRSIAHVLAQRYEQALVDAEAAFEAGAADDSIAMDAAILALLALGRRRDAERLARAVLQTRPDAEVARYVIDERNARTEQTVESLTSLARMAFRIATGGS